MKPNKECPLPSLESRVRHACADMTQAMLARYPVGTEVKCLLSVSQRIPSRGVITSACGVDSRYAIRLNTARGKVKRVRWDMVWKD